MKAKSVEIFSKYFGNIVSKPSDRWSNQIFSSDNDAVTMRIAVENYQDHPSIKGKYGKTLAQPIISILSWVILNA